MGRRQGEGKFFRIFIKFKNEIYINSVLVKVVLQNVVRKDSGSNG